MIETPLFLSIVATGVGFIALWVVADVAKKLTSLTQERISDSEADMVRMIARSEAANQKLEAEVFELRSNITKQNKTHKRECARLNALITQSEVHRLQNSKVATAH